MLQTYSYQDLSASEINKLISRNADEDQTIGQRVEGIIAEVRSRGDEALKAFAEKFDGVKLDKLFIEKAEIAQIAAGIGAEQKAAIDLAYANISAFHAAQKHQEAPVDTMPGVTCWREARAIERVGLYIPGGSAVLPSTFLMLGIPARIAGCKEIVVCSPPQKDGLINCYVAYVAVLLDVERVYLAGGAQAVAAMAYGTDSVPRTDKIFGPGNQYVTKAKTLIQSTTQTAIDMPAGPSEVLVLADEGANPEFVAADLLAQAEHGADSQAILVSNSSALISETVAALERQLAVLPRAEIAAKAIANSYAVLTADLVQAMDFSNLYAPEHLILATANWKELIPSISNAGSVFLGHLTPESAGDYASGTNHTLPTSAYARSYSGVSLDSFIKKITFQHISPEGVHQIGKAVEVLAELEGLQAHKNAMSVRISSVNS
ncbi:histidinol dehydrogenase [Arcticibacter pallidicorallinus]|uniref:Histidinol dehydrogenase n=1 Tax=Arcticibacter pallidicorallinus TaxID=1259464 RepID=A0A2T0U477_9SPHI|nr:histidinol dehydrogenase [Arcticibacter pallidicorallinus]PRY52684.1 histidinol dehydrogenase [Arcticibacter pallidicorallinus]